MMLVGVSRYISDLHLQPELDTVNQRFEHFLDDCRQRQIGSLFILGDLFEYWIGDDNVADPFNAWVAAQLSGLAGSGTQIFFIAGNRDFLLGNEYATACGMRTLDEQAIVGAGGTACLLLHGDTLCTDDVAYQGFREMVRKAQWQATFLARPLAERIAEVAELRRRSQEAMLGKAAKIMDVNAFAVRNALETNNCQRLIHGHTHRPGTHTVALGTAQGERWVLSDWTAERGDVIEIDDTGIRRLSLA